ncbi:replication initiation factor domain-containing protein [Vibrio cortegadensis]|uniref:replication initiation factor domain-containing protein n=2 Tax=Vibrio cortegadensis TaxID=1328770 RepID=UPI0021C32540|nr:replication initiation factor domain-containing protein [Vibrio cortegadensis]
MSADKFDKSIRAVKPYKPRDKHQFKVDHKALSDTVTPVFIDHLAWSMPIRSLSYLDGALDKDYVPYMMPVFHQPKGLTAEQQNEYVKRYQQEFYFRMNVCFELFMQKEFGMFLSPMRGRGLHGYEDSMTIFDITRTHELGFVGIGGNNDTIYIQINGTGCQYLFNKTTPARVHWLLTEIFVVPSLSRLDLAVDDFTGNFDAKYAERCWYEKAFKSSPDARRQGSMTPHVKYNDGGSLDEEATLIGSRSSTRYWRIYNKKFERKITDPDVVWYRNEVELKKISVDFLSDISASFAGLCDFAASIEPTPPKRHDTIKKKAILDIMGKVAWARKQCGKTLSEVIDFYNGDLEKAFGHLVPDKYKTRTIDMPDVHKSLVQAHLGIIDAPF